MANRFLNNITINDAYTLPSTDGTAGQAITTDGAGNLAFSTVDAGTADAALKITLRVKNVSGGTLNAGTLVRVAPSANPPSGNVLEVDIADNSAASTMPAVGILIASIADEAEGDAVAFGRASGFSTSGYTEGDPIWVGSNGAFVGTKPTGSDLIQKVGQVIKVHASNGSIEVFGAGRTNDVPNLSVGKIWVGTTTNTAESTLLEIDETNNILTVGGKIYYSNVFSQESDLPSATTYHGMFAHVHGTGYAYYAHAGAWVKLAKHSELVAAANDATITLTAGTGLSGGGDFTTDQATNETITVNLADTAVTPGTYGDADNTPQITIDQQGRVTSATTVATAGAGGGGAGGSMSAEINQYTGNGTTDAFSLTTASTDDDAVQVYLDGVYQVKTTANYSISGSTVTFVDPPTSGTAIEFVHFVNTSPSSLINKTFTASGTTADFDLVDTVSDENYTFVFIQGVYQEKSTYSITGSTLTFTTTPLAGYSIEVMIFGTVSLNNSGGISWDTTPKTTAFTATAGEGYFVNTTSGGVTVTLPTSPNAGDEVSIVDYAGTADTNNITITSSNNINGASDDLTINYERGGVSMVYVDATQGWIAYNAANETATSLAPSAISVDYLVVAGGGGGAGAAPNNTNGGGGGAGGLRTSYGSTSGGGASAESSLSLSPATNYTVTVGAGGSGSSGYSTTGGTGYNSVFSSITSDGGGGGGNYNAIASSGGSGGGEGSYSSTSWDGVGSGTLNQGYAGGLGVLYNASALTAAGGGGGASSVGSNSSSGNGGNGGAGLEVNIIGGTGNYYAGGGGGGGESSGGSGGAGNSSGMGAATNGSGGSASNNTGGGGGGATSVSAGPYSGGNGGSGVVIIRYPNTYTVTIGAGLTGSTATDGSDKVTTFTAGTGTISFS